MAKFWQSRAESKPQTADFFAEGWDNAFSEQPKQPIGQYLKQAGLLNERQIQTILVAQKQSERKFGELAISKGWIKQATIDFFLRYLQPGSNFASAAIESDSVAIAQGAVKEPQAVKDSSSAELNHRHLNHDRDNSQKVHEGFLQIKRKLLKIETEDSYSATTLERVLFWTKGHSLLTQKIFALIADSEASISPQQEEEQVDYVVQTQIIDNWSQNELKSHFNGIGDRLINNQHHPAEQLLMLYQKVLTEKVLLDNSPEQLELLNLGLVVKQQGRLVVANPIYQSVFNLSWAIQALKQQVSSKLAYIGSANREEQSKSSAIVATPTEEAEPKDSWFNLKNLLLLLALIGLFGVLVNNISRRVTVRQSFQQGNKLLNQNSYAEAIDEYNQLLEIDSNYFQAWTNRGYALAGLQEYEQMRDSCTTATIIDPNAVYAWNCRGEALHNLTRYEEAVEAFDRAISLNPNDPIFPINKSESLRALGDSKASVASIQQAVEVLESIESQAGAQKIKGEFAVALTLLGNSYRQEKEYIRAISAYDRAIEYSPNYFPARLSKGITLGRAERYSEAQAEFKLAIENSQLTITQQAQTWFYLGKTQCELGKSAEGVAAYERAIELNPDYAIAKQARKQCR